MSCRRDRLIDARLQLRNATHGDGLTVEARRLAAARAADSAKKAALRREDRINAYFVSALRCCLGLEPYAD